MIEQSRQHHPIPSEPLATAASACPPMQLLSYNIQAGIATSRYQDYFLHGWKHVLPSPDRIRNLDVIAELISHYDVVGLQETDAGSLRSHFLNQTEYLSLKSGLGFWHTRINRDLGHWGQHALGLLAQQEPVHVEERALPGLMPGRGVLLADFDWHGQPVRVINSHLALSRRARKRQLDMIRDLSCEDGSRHSIVMADFNCTPDSEGLRQLCDEANLHLPDEPPLTYPNWRPKRAIDHILVSARLTIDEIRALPFGVSDHAPLAVRVSFPDSPSCLMDKAP